MSVSDIKLNDLPSWDLSDLYDSPDSIEIAKDLEWLQSSIKNFTDLYKDKLALLTADKLLLCITEHEQIEKKIGMMWLSLKSLPYIWLWCASLNSFSNLSPSSSTEI